MDHSQGGGENVSDKSQKEHEKYNKEIVFLHGDLVLLTMEAKSLPNLDLSTEAVKKCLTMGNNCSPPFVKGLKTHSGKDKTHNK